jgi:uncharacterized protein YgiM (DUF1202 family)
LSNENEYSTVSKSTELTAKYVTATELNVRIGPSTNDTIITTINKGELVWVLETVDAVWVKIAFSKYDFSTLTSKTITGYVSSNYLN